MGSVRPLVFGDEPDDGAVLDAFVMLLVADPNERNSEGLAELVRRSLRLRGWLDAIDARIAARAAELADEGHGEAAATVLAGGGRRSKRDAEAAAARGATCERMPELGAALADGRIGAGHVDAVANAARHLDDGGKAELAEHAEALINAAEQMSPEQFDRQIRDLARDIAGDGGLSRHERLRQQRCVRRWVDRNSGMCRTLLSLDPLDDAKVWTAFNAAAGAARAGNQDNDERSWISCRPTPSSITSPAPTTGAGDGAGGLGAEVSVLIDYNALVHGGEPRVAETADGEALPVEVIRRLCCDGVIVPIWLGSDLEVLAVGRQHRLATRAQRRACGRCTGPAVCLTAWCRSSTAGSITSRSGNTTATPPSTTWCRSVNVTNMSCVYSDAEIGRREGVVGGRICRRARAASRSARLAGVRQPARPPRRLSSSVRIRCPGAAAREGGHPHAERPTSAGATDAAQASHQEETIMTIVVNGKAATKDGLASWVDEDVVDTPDGRLIIDVRHRYGALRAAEFAREHEPRIPLTWRHRDEIGEVVHLERRHGSLWATAVCERNIPGLFADPAPRFSVECDVRGRLYSIALTPTPAVCGLEPVEVVHGDLATAIRDTQQWPKRRGLHERLTRAADYDRTRRRGDPHVIQGAPPPPVVTPQRVSPKQPPGRIHYGPPGAI